MLVQLPKAAYSLGHPWKLIPTAFSEFVTNIVQSWLTPTWAKAALAIALELTDPPTEGADGCCVDELPEFEFPVFVDPVFVDPELEVFEFPVDGAD